MQTIHNFTEEKNANLKSNNAKQSVDELTRAERSNNAKPRSISFRSPTGCAITYLILLIDRYFINYFIICLKGATIITDRRMLDFM